MRRLVVLGVALGVVIAMLPPVWAAVKLNSSKSNIYRVTYPDDLLTKEQAAALLADLEKARPGSTSARSASLSASEVELKQWLAANFRRFGIVSDRIKKIVIMFPTPERARTYGVTDPTTWIILLTNPADEAAAIATTVKGSKSNSSD